LLKIYGRRSWPKPGGRPAGFFVFPATFAVGRAWSKTESRAEEQLWPDDGERGIRLLCRHRNLLFAGSDKYQQEDADNPDRGFLPYHMPVSSELGKETVAAIVIDAIKRSGESCL